MSNRIEQVIGDIEEYIDGCKMQAFSNTKIIVDRPQLEEFLDELRQYTPEEVKKYQRMLNNRDKILSDAKKKASEIEDKAQAYAEHMVNENQITRMAYEKANEILRARWIIRMRCSTTCIRSSRVRLKTARTATRRFFPRFPST